MSHRGRSAPNAELHMHADRAAQYEHVAQVMSAAANARIAKIGFITEPPREY
jgi:biopolymer transport protein ExbD